MALSPVLSKLLKESKQKHTRASGKVVKFKEGKTTIRLLAADFSKQFWRDVGVHWIKTDLKGKPVAVVGCNSDTFDEPCAICAALDKAAQAAPDDETLKLIKEMKARKSVLVAALVRKAPGDAASEDPQIVEMTPTTWAAIINIIEQYGDEDIDALDYKDGIDIVVTRSGTGLDTEYTVNAAPKSIPVDPSINERLPDLDAFIKSNFFRGDEPKALNAIASVSGSISALPNASTKALLTGATVDEDEDEDEVAPSPAELKAQRAAAKKAEKPAPAAVEDDNDVGFEDDEIDAILDGLDD